MLNKAQQHCSFEYFIFSEISQDVAYTISKEEFVRIQGDVIEEMCDQYINGELLTKC